MVALGGENLFQAPSQASLLLPPGMKTAPPPLSLPPSMRQFTPQAEVSGLLPYLRTEEAQGQGGVVERDNHDDNDDASNKRRRVEGAAKYPSMNPNRMGSSI